MTKHLTKMLASIGSAVNGIAQGSSIGKFLIGVGSAIVGFFSPIVYLLLICFVATVVDMIYGIKVALKKNTKIESSKTWSGTLTKVKAELVLIGIAHGLEWAVLDQHGVFVLTGGITFIITLTELWSILENLNTLDPKGPWRALGKFLKKKGEDYTGIEINLDNEHNNDADVASKSLEGSR